MVGLKINRGTSFIETPLPLIVVVTFMIAMMCILLGLLAEMITRTFYESQGKAIYNIRSTSNFQEINATPELKPQRSAPEDQYRASR
jgi:hypothetical protein